MHVDDPALYEAIGRVAAQSALFDEELRGIIYELVEGRDYLWPLFEGQGTDWLIKTLLSILDNIDPRSHFLSAEHHARLRSALKEVTKNLSPMRNVVIHGTWSHKPTHRDEDLSPWPWSLSGGGVTLYCQRSRLRKVFEEYPLSVGDVEHLSDLFADARMNLIVILRVMLHRLDREA